LNLSNVDIQLVKSNYSRTPFFIALNAIALPIFSAVPYSNYPELLKFKTLNVLISPKDVKNSLFKPLFNYPIPFISNTSKLAEILNNLYKLSITSVDLPKFPLLEIFKWINLGENAKLYRIDANPFSVILGLLLISTYYIYLALIKPSVISFAISALNIDYFRSSTFNDLIFVIKPPSALAPLVYWRKTVFTNLTVFKVSANLPKGENIQSTISAYEPVAPKLKNTNCSSTLGTFERFIKPFYIDLKHFLGNAV
jgi:hypothetical protein